MLSTVSPTKDLYLLHPANDVTEELEDDLLGVPLRYRWERIVKLSDGGHGHLLERSSARGRKYPVQIVFLLPLNM